MDKIEQGKKQIMDAGKEMDVGECKKVVLELGEDKMEAEVCKVNPKRIEVKKGSVKPL